ncbi:uncharacterized protein JN550_000556 [Neoarthrinium moseri]|uniref:uncharacterized protein n=1 Tax=Neoarthrinium moseri TaxID=1658444 RepID=UPI001FDB8742|nr:uncharacterized protein JN550_000556 [Neoarthrinium moseri]KAI1878374.1 hypothetical protein JN550_000556 [Neoarthrinium moseri]
MATIQMPRKYKYPHLPNQCIRVLELQPETSADAGLRCRLVVQKIDNIPYEALSYVWGKPTVYHSAIYCQDGTDEDDEGEIRIGGNLTRALIAYRLTDRPRRIWVDAICINQDDLAERQAQVRMMGAIFHGAQQVLCWLGGFKNPELEEPAALIAIGFLRQFNTDPAGELRKVQEYLHHDVKSQADDLIHMSWLGIKILFDIEYFHRAWIIQEVGLAHRAILSWGRSDVCLDWVEIALFSSFMDANGASIVNRFDLKSWVCNHISLVWSKRPDGQPVFDFSEVLHWARIHLSTDPRDYVYALLGHPSATIEGELIIEPSYMISTAQVYTNLASNIIERTNSVHILAFVDHGGELDSSELATWVPDWHAPNVVAPLRFPTCAAPKSVECISIDPDRRLLRCQGFVVDTLVAYSDMIVPKELPITTYDAEMKKSIPFLVDHIYNRLVVDTCIPLESWERFVHSLSSILTGGTRAENPADQGDNMTSQRGDCAAFMLKAKQIQQSNNATGFWSSLQADERDALEHLAMKGSPAQFIQDMTWTSMCRKVFRTTRGYFGLGPRIMKKNDAIVINL